MIMLVKPAFAALLFVLTPIVGVTQEPMQDDFLSQVSPNRTIVPETYEPFSGSYTFKSIDINVPGIAGHDLVIQRYYSPNVWNRTDTAAVDAGAVYHQAATDSLDLLGGNGWQLHMGKVRNPWGIGSGQALHAPDNPTVVMPDGSTHKLYQCFADNSKFPCETGDLVTSEGWRYRLETGPDEYPAIWSLALTNGMTYFFEAAAASISGCFAGPCYPAGADVDQATSYRDFLGTLITQAVEIRDQHGNSIYISHDKVWGRIESVVDTVGREVRFKYTNTTSNPNIHDDDDPSIRPRLTDIELYENNSSSASFLQGWSFDYYSPWEVEYDLGFQNPLKRQVYSLQLAQPPNGNSWGYSYHNDSITGGGAALAKVSYPSGASTDYSYTTRSFNAGHSTGTLGQLTLSKKEIKDSNTLLATWDYAIVNPGDEGQKTTVTGPNGYTETYRMHGWSNFDQLPTPPPNIGPDRIDTNLWRTGLVYSSSVSYGGQTTTTQTSYTAGTQLSWDYQATTPWSFFVGGVNAGRLLEGVFFARPTETTTTITRDGGSYATTQSGYTDYGHPTQIEESGDADRSTTLSYWYNKGLRLLDGRVSTRQADPGGRSTHKYNSIGMETERMENPSSLTATNGIKTALTYYSNGNLESTTVGNIKTSFSHTWGQLSSTTVGSSFTTVIRNHDIHPLGIVVKEDDSRGNLTERSFDNSGRLIAIDPPGTSSAGTSIVYSSDRRLMTVERDGYKMEYHFDAFGHLLLRKDLQTDDELVLTYNALGRKTSESLRPGGQGGDTTTFDGLGRPLKIEHADGTSVGYVYNLSSTTVKDERNNSTKFEYQNFGSPGSGRLVGVVDANGNDWGYTYDEFNLLYEVDAPGTKFDRSFQHDHRLLLTGETHPESGVTSYEYTAAAQLQSRTKGGEAINYAYDAAARLTSMGDVTFGYDGELRTITSNSDATIELEYDDAGRLTKRKTTLSGLASSFDIKYSYDSRDRPTKIVYPSGRTIAHSYDTKDRLIMVRDESINTDLVSDLEYSVSGRVTNILNEGGVKTDYAYNDRFLLESMEAGTSSSVNDIADITFHYDDSGNLETWTDNRNQAASRSFEYDNLNRLTKTVSTLWNEGATQGTREYRYDEHGNRTTVLSNGISSNYQYNNNGQLVSIGSPTDLTIAYDNAGRAAGVTRLIQDPDPDDPDDPNNPPPDEALAYLTVSCVGLECTFDANGSMTPNGIGRIEWDFDGDGFADEVDFASQAAAPPPLIKTYIYPGTGARTSIIKVCDFVNTALCDTASRTANPEEIDPLPTAIFTVDCDNSDLSCEFDASGSSDDSGIVSYAWWFGEVDFDPDTPGLVSTEPFASHVYAVADNYSVRLVVTDEANQTVAATETATPGVPPTISSLDGLNRSKKSGALIVTGYALSPVGIDWSPEEGKPLFLLDAQAMGPFPIEEKLTALEYGLPRPGVCDWVEQRYGWTDPNCPFIGFQAILDTRLLGAEGPNFPFGRSATLRMWRVTNTAGFTDFLSTSQFWSKVFDDRRVPWVGFANVQGGSDMHLKVPKEVIDGQAVVFRGWAMDDTGVALVDFELDDGSGWRQWQPTQLWRHLPAPRDPANPSQSICDNNFFITTLDDPNCPFQTGWQATFPQGQLVMGQIYRLRVTGRDLLGKHGDTTATFELVNREPFGDGPALIPTQAPAPSFIEVETFDLGGQDVAYFDATPGNSGTSNVRVGEDVDLQAFSNGHLLIDIDAGEWLEYEVKVASSGFYRFHVSYQDSDGESFMRFEKNGFDLTELMQTEITTGTQFKWLVSERVFLQATKPLTQDRIRLRFPYDAPNLKIHRFRILPEDDLGQGPPGVPPKAIPGTIQWETFDVADQGSGQRISYQDNDDINLAEAPLLPEESVETLLLDNRWVVEAQAGEWLEYSISVGATATYDLSVSYRTESAGTVTLALRLDDQPLGYISLPGTQGSWQSRRVSGFKLTAGSRVLNALVAHGTAFLDSMSIVLPTAAPPPPSCQIPAAQPDHLVALSGQLLNISASADLLANDGTGDLELRSVTAPLFGNLTWLGDALTYEQQGAPVDDFFTYEVGIEGHDCSAAVAVSIDIDTPPHARFTETCSGLTCAFSAATSTDDISIQSFRWDLGDGVITSPSTSSSKTHTYAVGGTYEVELTVSDTVGQTESTNRLVALDEPPQADFSVECQGTLCSFDGSASTDDIGITSYHWDFGDDQDAASSDPMVVHDFSSGGDYIVKLTVSDSLGQTDTDSSLIVLDTPPIAVLVVSCDDLDCIFDGTASDDDHTINLYRWDFGDGSGLTTTEDAVVVHTFLEEGLYTVTLTVIDSAGQLGSTESAATPEDFIQFLLNITK